MKLTMFLGLRKILKTIIILIIEIINQKKLFLNYEKLNTVLSKIKLCLLLMCY